LRAAEAVPAITAGPVAVASPSRTLSGLSSGPASPARGAAAPASPSRSREGTAAQMSAALDSFATTVDRSVRAAALLRSNERELSWLFAPAGGADAVRPAEVISALRRVGPPSPSGVPPRLAGLGVGSPAAVLEPPEL
jgi:hypothetical protein